MAEMRRADEQNMRKWLPSTRNRADFISRHSVVIADCRCWEEARIERLQARAYRETQSGHGRVSGITRGKISNTVAIGPEWTAMLRQGERTMAR